jgi:quercetin dioxygenase-like cupin family protein
MNQRRLFGAALGGFGFAVVFAAGQMFAQQKPADPNRPLSENVAKVNLEEVGLAGGAASVTRFTYAPGKAMPPHTHTGRTSIIVIVQGQLTGGVGTPFAC